MDCIALYAILEDNRGTGWFASERSS